MFAVKIPLHPKQIALLKRGKELGQRRFVVGLGGLFLLVTIPIACKGVVEMTKPHDTLSWIEATAFFIYFSCGVAFLQAFFYWHLLNWLREHSVPRKKD